MKYIWCDIKQNNGCKTLPSRPYIKQWLPDSDSASLMLNKNGTIALKNNATAPSG